MKRHRFIEPVCIVCLIETARKFVELSESNTERQFKKLLTLIHKVELMFKGDLSNYMELSKQFYDACREILGDFDYFNDIKYKSNELAFSLAYVAKNYINSGSSIEDRLRRAIKLSLVGNALDFGTGVYNISFKQFKQEFYKLLSTEIALDESDKLIKYVHNAENILYVLDNAGEVVFDKLFIDEVIKLKKEVVAAVRGDSVQNDVTLEDVKYIGLEDIARVITTGSNIAGILLRDCSEDFIDELRQADLVILKGQGNYQSIDEIFRIRKKNLAFLLRVKCAPVAKDLGVRFGDFVVKVY